MAYLFLLVPFGMCFATDIDTCGSLASANTVYTLNASISNSSTCFTIAAENITLDCAGFSITGNNTTNSYGIYGTFRNATIRNCNIGGFNIGIYLKDGGSASESPHYSLIDNVNISSPMANGYGISVTRTTWTAPENITISNSVINGSTYGVSLGNYGGGHTIANSTVYSFSTGVYLNNQQKKTTITNLTAYANATGLYSLSSPQTDVRGGMISSIRADSSSNSIYDGVFINGTGTSNLGAINFDTSCANMTLINFSVSNTTTAVRSGLYLNSQNTTINCMGKEINGSNYSGTYGIITQYSNATIVNCSVNNFPVGMYVGANSRVENNSISVSSASSYSNAGITLPGANTTITGNYIRSHGSLGMYMQCSNCKVSNNTFNTSYQWNGWYGASIRVEGGGNASIENNTMTNTLGSGIAMLGSGPITNISVRNNTILLPGSSQIGIAASGGVANSSFWNNSIRGGGSYGFYGYSDNGGNLFYDNVMEGASFAITLQTFSNGSIFNNRLNGTSTYVIYFSAGTVQNNSFYNNTLISSAGTGTLVYITGAGQSGNIFYWNNFTHTTGYYVNDLNGSNYYNHSGNGTNLGNIWFNLMNGSVAIAGNVTTPWAGTYYGSTGSHYPYNSSNSQSKVSSGVVDYAPVTPLLADEVISVNWSVYAHDSGWFTAQDSYNGIFQIGINPSASGDHCTMTICTPTAITCYNTTNSSVAVSTANISLVQTGLTNNQTYEVWATCYNTAGQSANTSVREFSVLPDIQGEIDMGYLEAAVLVGLGLAALLFAYLHVNARSWIWSKCWFFFACLMVVGELMAIVNFADLEGNTTLSAVGLALFAGFVWIFIIAIWAFLFELIKIMMDSSMDWLHGRKREREKD